MILIYAECGEYSDYRFEVLGYDEDDWVVSWTALERLT